MSKKKNYSQYYVLAGIIVLTIIIYAKSIHAGLLYGWDDNVYVSNNHDITDLSFHGLKHLFSGFYVNCYLPLTMLTYALEYKFFGLNPAVYHIDNILLHLLNTILVFFFVKSLFSSLSTPYSMLPTAFFCTLLFAVHPMHVESVAWVSERKDLLYTFFFLASLIFYLKHIKKETQDTSIKTQKNQHSTFCFLSLLMFLFSLLSKSMAVTLPVVLLLIDYLKARLKFNTIYSILTTRYLLEKLPFFILALIFGVIAVISQRVYDPSNFNEYVLNKTFIDTFFMFTYSIAFYIVNLVAPFNLSPIHPFPIKFDGFLPLEYYLSSLFIGGLLYLFLRIIKRTTNNELQRTLIFGILFFMITISVVLIVPVGYALVAERYTYVPYLGFFFIIGSFADSKIARLKGSEINLQIFKSFNLLIVLAFCVMFSVLTFSRVDIWKDGITLFTDVIEKHPDVSIAYNTRGCAKNNTGDFKGALEDFNKAIALVPGYATAYNNRGWAKTNTNDLNGAMEDFNKAIALNPDYETAFCNRGGLKEKFNDFNGAVEDLNKAISMSLDDAIAYSNRGWAKTMMHDYTGAIDDFNKAIALSPGLAMAYSNRGLAKANSGDFKSAMDDYDKAIILNPSLVIAYVYRGSLKGNMNDFAGALKDFDKAISFNASDAMGYYYRGLTKSNLQDLSGAMQDLNKAIILNPNYAMAFFVRGNVSFSLNDRSSACNDWNAALKFGWKGAQNKIEEYCR